MMRSIATLRRELGHLLGRLAGLAFLAAGLTLGASAQASTVDISSTPLSNSTATVVKPNLMFVLDDSGSMDWDFMPDWANDGFCRASGATPANSGTWDRACCQAANGGGSGNNACYRDANRRAHPPFMNPAFNGVAYNPAVRYRPAVNADGTSRPSMNSANTLGWTAVPTDAYGVQSTTAYSLATISLLTQYPDTEWCTDGTFTHCLRNGNYVLPGSATTVESVGGVDVSTTRNYTTFRAVFATGSGQIAVGAPDSATTETRSFGPHYYRVVASEWCNSENLRDCVAAPTASHTIPAPLRWCNSDANARAATPAANSCQAVRTTVYTHARYPTKVISPGVAAVAATPARVSFTVSLSGTCNSSNRPSFSAVTVNGVNLLAAATTADNNPTANELGAALRAGIASGGSSYAVSGTNNTVTLTAPVAAGAITHAVSFTRATNACVVTINPTAPAFSGFVAATPAVAGGFPGRFERVDIVPAVTSYPKAAARTDCAGSTCTYAEEMTNFANWFAYYRTRMQTMKTGVGLAFAAVDDRFRVGYYTLNNGTGTDFRNFQSFTGTAKDNWFTQLRAARPSGSTPLKTALSTVGRLYAGRLNGSNLRGATVVDPQQYSCQQNFTLMSTDGYTNETGIPRQVDGTTEIGNQDGTLPRPFRDGLGASNTLADIAAYYYATDLRSTTLANCTSGSTGEDVCANNVPIGGTDTATHQHMTTFTLGLGVSGFMQFRPDYRTATSGDYFAVANGSTVNLAGGICTWLTSGTCEWPIPLNNDQTAVDDLWHAAVNGRGSYFSASDPDSLFTGLSGALAELDKKVGAAAAATTSNPNVSAGDNFVFISNYTSGEWSGELLGKTINLTTGVVEDAATDWSARTRLEANTSRTIYMFSATEADKLADFTWTNINTAGLNAFFELAHISTGINRLSQYCTVGTTCLTAAAKAAAPGEPLVNFLRGDRSHEGTELETEKYFRKRTYLLGDIVNSEAVYVRKAMFNYVDSGYASFKAGTETRRAMVYVGANDGMLHAFDATTGDELWAYVPTAVFPRLYRLADKAYETRHTYFVDSTPVVSDVKIGGQWRTILVGGLGAGGRAYYALDITDPASPKALWEFTNNNLGLSFGRAEITKRSDGTWVVIVASGYNNPSPGDGAGRIFVLDAATGALLASPVADDTTNTGPASTGLAHLRAWVEDADLDNTTKRVYAGDNAGNVWRFDLTGTLTPAVVRLATLRGSGGLAQPVTSRPELGDVDGRAMVFVGTGRYLGTSDLVDTRPQSLYGIKDPLTATGWGNPRASTSFVAQALTNGTCPTGSAACTAGETVRLSADNVVDLGARAGWYVDLPVTSERSTNDPQLALGTLVVTTNVVESSTCTAGGYSFINFFNYRTGGAVSTAEGVVSTPLGSALATRPTVVRLPSGRIVSITRLFDDSTAVRQVPVPPGGGVTRRLSWRELPTEQ
jgi:type IV pilus assembly protein PilY1